MSACVHYPVAATQEAASQQSTEAHNGRTTKTLPTVLSGRRVITTQPQSDGSIKPQGRGTNLLDESIDPHLSIRGPVGADAF